MILEQVQNKDVYMFDEPSSYLDVKQRLAAARVIRSLSKHDNYIIGSSPLVTLQFQSIDTDRSC